MTTIITLNLVVPTFKNSSKLVNAIYSMIDATSDYDCVIYIVDNNVPAGLDPIAQDLFSGYPNIVVLNGDENGPCQARNKAVRLMRFADYVFFLDDDVVINRDYIHLSLRAFEKQLDAGAITFNSYLVSSPLRSIFRSLLISLLFLGRIRDPRGIARSRVPCNVVSGGNFAIRGEFVDTVNWDESYKGYSFAEDVDFGIRATREMNIYYEPDVNLIHDTVLKNESDTDILRRYLGYCYVVKKNFSISAIIIINLSVMFVLRAVLKRRPKLAIDLLVRFSPKVIFAPDHSNIIKLYSSLG
ncbi:glycosyltransferase [Pseudohongiella sp. SYSU M77423]|uniref:glycosyltransferase family 2 protein n=1 Tax=Pseudohongiella sp. SYSU M77423 TaxID=3042312 RepID=UPI00247FA318|nr:glycosyltransferase [Pseudohongiella sp. SYSU M77423]MDH7944929.1 glycosyltransferase [Pseudohongiella sp. SYSU M77423]